MNFLVERNGSTIGIHLSSSYKKSAVHVRMHGCQTWVLPIVTKYAHAMQPVSNYDDLVSEFGVISIFVLTEAKRAHFIGSEFKVTSPANVQTKKHTATTLQSLGTLPTICTLAIANLSTS